MIFDKRKMVRVLKFTTSYWVKRAKRNNQFLLRETPKQQMLNNVAEKGMLPRDHVKYIMVNLVGLV